uniref:Uncharacterized protein n=1 Tax=Rhizophora mucronata TaxID=61149 RepID=A0A2P2R278_RHIMU
MCFPKDLKNIYFLKRLFLQLEAVKNLND